MNNNTTNTEHIENLIAKGLVKYTVATPGFKSLFVLSLMQHVTTLIMPFSLIFIMSKIWHINSILTYIELGTMFVLLGLLLVIISYIKEYKFFEIQKNENNNISIESLKLLLSIPYNNIGHLPIESKYSRYLPLRKFTDTYYNEVVKSFLDLPLIIMSFSIICYLLGFAYFSFVVVLLLSSIFISRYILSNKKYDPELSDAAFNGIIHDTFCNYNFIYKNNLLQHFSSKIKNLIEKRASSEYITNIKVGISDNVIEALLMVLYIGSLVFAVYSVLDGQLNVNNLIIIIILIWFCITPFKALVDSANKIGKINEIINQFRLLKNSNVYINRHKKIDLDEDFKGSIMLKSVNLHFSKAGGFALNNINFNVDRGEVLLINGMSGSGKSTILKLLAGLYTPASGIIAIDLDINVIDNVSLDKNIILIDSKPFLNSNSVLDNIKLRDTSLSDDEIFDLSINLKSKNCNTFEQITDYSLSEIQQSNILNMDYNKIINQLILSKIPNDIKDKIILIDEPFLNYQNDNIKEFANKIRKIKKHNTIIICSRYNFYSPLANKIVIMGDGKILKYFKKDESD